MMSFSYHQFRKFSENATFGQILPSLKIRSFETAHSAMFYYNLECRNKNELRIWPIHILEDEKSTIFSKNLFDE